jgi:DHA1 family bicyclomycin/chloramphenicol resistance-like MFS transporter
MEKRKELKYLFLIFTIFIAACIETDIYLPAFPDMMTWFKTTEGAIQSLLTWNFVGICISGPFYGPLADAFGRKKPLMAALSLFLAGSLITLYAQNIDQMLMGRVLQGIGSGGCFTLGTAIIFDTFQKDRAISALNTLNMAIPLIMAAAPMLGGYLNQVYGFRSNFLAIGVFVLISFIVCIFFFKETLPKEKRAAFKIKSILADFSQAFRCLPFWQLTLVTSLLFAGYIAFLSGTSVLFVVEFGMSKTIFPFIQGAILGGWVLGSLMLNRSIAKWGVPQIKKAGTNLCVVGVLTLALATWIAPRDPYLLTIGMVIYALGANWVIGLYFPEGMEILPHIKGITASLLTSVRLLIAALIVGLTSSCYNSTIYPLTAVVVGTFAIILPTLFLYEKNYGKKRVSQGDAPTQISH